MSKVAVGIATITYSEGLVAAVESLYRQTAEPDIFVVCNGPWVRETVEQLAAEEKIRAHYATPVNLGVAGSWNFLAQWAFNEGYDFIVIMGDDIRLIDPSALRLFASSVKENAKNLYYVYDRGFSTFCLTKELVQEIGFLDEGFWPGYFEDNDYYRRLMLANRGWIGLFLDTSHVGSASININPMLRSLNGAFFPSNEQRYIAKWGGKPHEETFTIPWNGQPAWPGLGGDRIFP